MKTYSDGEMLKFLRERFQPRQGETQTQTAAKLGVSVQFIQQVLDGQRPISPNLGEALGYHPLPRRWAKKA